MKKFIELTKFFIQESTGRDGYMKGYSKWYIYSRMPKAYIKFMWYSYNP